MTTPTIAEPGTELATFDASSSKFPILFDQEGGGIAEILEDNFGDEGFRVSDLDRVKIPAAGGRYWDIPDERPTDIIEGVVILKQKTRSYWVKELGDGEDSNTPPDCSSADGKIGIGLFGKGTEGNPDGECDKCPMNVFGSGKNNSKACKEQQQLYLLREGGILPLHIALPPTSLSNFRKYLTRLTSKSTPFYGVVTRIGLEQDKGPAGDFSIATFERGDTLLPPERDAAKVYGQSLKGTLDQAAVARDAAREAAAAGEAAATHDAPPAGSAADLADQAEADARAQAEEVPLPPEPETTPV